MRRVLKFKLSHTAPVNEFTLRGGRFLHVGIDGTGAHCIWMEEDDTKEEVTSRFVILGTGWPIPDGGCTYQGSWTSGEFVWHLYEVDE
jgi:hypothetical protein